MDTWDKGIIHVLDGMVKFHLATQNGTHFKTYELFISGTFNLIFLDCGLPQVTEMA